VPTWSQPDLSCALKKKTKPLASGPARQEPKKSRCLVDRGSEKSSKFYRGYTILVRGQIPGDIEERVSRLHGSALRKNGRQKGEDGGRDTRGRRAGPDDAQIDV